MKNSKGEKEKKNVICKDFGKSDPVERHTIAHGGFNEDFIELRKSNDAIWVRLYCRSEKKVFELLNKLFEENLVIKLKSTQRPEYK